MKFDVLHNFISPVTGRILCDPDYVLVGDDRGVALPSPILIDIQLDIINIRFHYDKLVLTDFIIGHPNNEIPRAQVLSILPDGFMYNTAGIVSTSAIIPITSLPNLTYTYIWTGDSTNRPIEVQCLILDNLPNLTLNKVWIGDATNRPVEGTLPLAALPDLTYTKLWTGDITNRPIETQIIILENLPNLGFSAGPLINAGKIWRGTIDNRPIESDDLTDLEADVRFISLITLPGMQAQIDFALGAITVIQGQVIVIFDALAGIETRISNLHLEGFVTSGEPSITGAFTTVRGATCVLNNIPAEANVSFSNFKIINLADPTNSQDAVNLRTLTTALSSYVLSVNGTIGQINSTGGQHPILSLASTGVLAGSYSYTSVTVDTFGRITNISSNSSLITLIGDVSGSGNLGTSIVTTFNLTLNQINNAGNININNFKIINLADPTDPQDAVNLRTMETYVADNGAKFLTDFVIGGPPVAGVMQTFRGPTCLLTNIPAGGDVSMDDFRIKNLQQSPQEDFDAISMTFLWDLMHDEVNILWP